LLLRDLRERKAQLGPLALQVLTELMALMALMG
jgi:hypothetical protein